VRQIQNEYTPTGHTVSDGRRFRYPSGQECGADWYRVLVEQIDDAVTVVDADGTITYVSPAVTRILGYDTEELVGREGYEFVHPEDRERNTDAMETVLSDPSTSETVELRFHHADGSWRWIEATMRNRLDDDIIDGILLSSRDITERKTYEAEAQKLAEEYEALLDNVEDAIFLITVEGDGSGIRFEFERLSPSYERQTGITTEEVQGQTPQDVFGEEQGAWVRGELPSLCQRRRTDLISGGASGGRWGTVLANEACAGRCR